MQGKNALPERFKQGIKFKLGRLKTVFLAPSVRSSLEKRKTLSRPLALSRAKASTPLWSRRMLNYVRIVNTPTADVSGFNLLLHFDHRRYVFGQVPECTQRSFVQRQLSLLKLEHIFLSGPVRWRSAGGLLGLLLTMADAHASSKEQSASGTKKKGKQDDAALLDRSLHIHAGKNISYLLATARRFIFRKGFPLVPHEVTDHSSQPLLDAANPHWKDDHINVWYMLVDPEPKGPHDLAPAKKRSHSEFSENDTANPPPPSNEADAQTFLETVVSHMFDSSWTPDALIETTLHKVHLPAKIFVRDENGRTKPYEGPMPGENKDVPDIPVRVRQPWPGANITALPSTQPSKQSLCYFVKGHERRGKFNPKAAEQHGVDKRDYRRLTSGETITTKDGTVVTPEMVLGASIPGIGFALIDLPDVSYVGSIIDRAEWTDAQLMSGIKDIFWSLGPGVINDSRLQEFMRKWSSLNHIVNSPDACPNTIALESAAAQAYKLWTIDPDRFPLVEYSNKASVTGRDTTDLDGSEGYEVGRIGKQIQFAPQYMHQAEETDNSIIFDRLIRTGLDQTVLDLAAKGRERVANPDFLARVEKAEADLPNRDAEVITLGTGSAMPSKYRNVSSTMVRVPGYGNYIFDCGEGSLGQLRRVFGAETSSVLRDLRAIWISHLHADHHLGTAAMIKAWHEETKDMDDPPKLLVSSSQPMLAWLREYSQAEDIGFHRIVGHVVHIRKSPGKDPSTTLTGLEEFGLEKIDACLVDHCHGALATVFTWPSGLKVAYSGDCRPSKDFVKIGQGATLLIHESTFDDELQGDAVAKKHSTMAEAIDVGRQMGARRIMLTHFSQRYQKIPLFEEEFGAETEGKTDEAILVAFDYMRVKLGEFRKAQAFLPAIQKLFEEEES
ncbi:beta-lactamase-like protein [Xylariaceae sp. FL0594]|nr:beta-lactamase-like protein [Xylariaceae sp. FL0594]